jgi:hypothetical protein
VLAPLLVAEVRVARPARDDQRVVGKPRLALAVRQAGEEHLAAGEVEAGDLGLHHAGVPLAAQDDAQRRCDLGGRERARRGLVDERLEEGEVLPVDERDLDRRPAQAAHRLQAAEAAAHDDDAVDVVGVGDGVHLICPFRLSLV